MPEFNVKVEGDRMTDVTLHSSYRVPYPIPGAKLPNGKDLERQAGDYVIVCITQYGEPGATVRCTVTGANDTQRTNEDTLDDQGKLTLLTFFRLTEEGEVL